MLATFFLVFEHVAVMAEWPYLVWAGRIAGRVACATTTRPPASYDTPAECYELHCHREIQTLYRLGTSKVLGWNTALILVTPDAAVGGRHCELLWSNVR